MRPFEPAHLETLARERNFLADQSEWRCPACGRVAIRTYVYKSYRGNAPILISHTWCAACRRATGSTGPLPKGLTFTDPWENLTPQERVQREGKKMFDELDSLWDARTLPQRFQWKK